MQRAAFPELQGRPRPPRHRRQARPDRVLLGLKIATFVAACGVLGVIVLLAGGGTSKPAPRATPPRTGTGQLGDDAPGYQPPPTSAQPVIEPPALRTETAEIKQVPTSKPKPAPSTRPSSVPPRLRLPAAGEPCPEPGMWSMTQDFEPVLCSGDSPPRWRKVF